MSRWEGRLDRFVLWLDKTAQDGLVVTAARGSWRGARGLGRRAFSIEVETDLIDEERICVATQRHWIAAVPSVVAILLAMSLLGFVLFPGGIDTRWWTVIVPFVLLLVAVDSLQRTRKDLFVVTTFRVMRHSGVYSRKEAEMPLGRVLDITAEKPFWLRPFGAGHLILENAGQEQGLREVRYIPDPSAIKHLIAELHAAPKSSRHSAEAPHVAAHLPRKAPGARYWVGVQPQARPGDSASDYVASDGAPGDDVAR